MQKYIAEKYFLVFTQQVGLNPKKVQFREAERVPQRLKLMGFLNEDKFSLKKNVNFSI